MASAQVVSPQVGSCNVCLPRPAIAPWVESFIDECSPFPNAKYDDQMTQVLNRLRGAICLRRSQSRGERSWVRPALRAAPARRVSGRKPRSFASPRPVGRFSIGKPRVTILPEAERFSYDDVNGVKFWENDPSYTRSPMGRIVVRDSSWKDGTLAATMDWRDQSGKVLLVETRNMVFSGDARLRAIDFEITLTAAVDVTFGDTKEGAFAIRLHDAFIERKGAKIVDADGRAGMVQVWGKRSNWVDYTAELESERLGVAIFDHPQSPRNPTYWHARDYGLFALNPFGRSAFDPKQEESQWKLYLITALKVL